MGFDVRVGEKDLLVHGDFVAEIVEHGVEFGTREVRFDEIQDRLVLKEPILDVVERVDRHAGDRRDG